MLRKFEEKFYPRQYTAAIYRYDELNELHFLVRTMRQSLPLSMTRCDIAVAMYSTPMKKDREHAM